MSTSTALFTFRGVPVVQVEQFRIKQEERDPNLFYYDIRHEDNDWGEPCSLEKRVWVNHFGTMATSEPISEEAFESAGDYQWISLSEEDKAAMAEHW